MYFTIPSSCVRFLPLLILLLSLHFPVFAQYTDPFAAKRIKHWVKKSEHGNLVEGTYSLQVSAPEIELISLLAAPIEPYQTGSDKNYYIHYFSPTATPYLLTVQEKRIISYYALESKLGTTGQGPGSLGPWQVGKLLNRLNISPQNLAVRLQVISDLENYYLPVSVFHSHLPMQAERAVYAHLRLGRSISGGSYRVSAADNAQHVFRQDRIRRQLGGSVLSLKVPVADFNPYQGWVKVELTLHELGSVRKIVYPFYFYYHGDERPQGSDR